MSVASKKINLNDLTSNEMQVNYNKAYQQPGVFQELFNSDQAEFACQQFSQEFRSLIQCLLVEKNIIEKSIPLEDLHKYIDADMRAYNFNDGVNKVSTFFYETNLDFNNLYLNFVKNFIYKHIVKEDFYFQAIPTIRLHCPNAENSNHYPRYHTDIGYGHPPKEVNIWLPLTDTIGVHGFKIMNLHQSNKLLAHYNYDFQSFIEDAINNQTFNGTCSKLAEDVTCPFGNVLFFDSRCIHSGEPMKTCSRVSIDTRIIRVKDYQNDNIEYQGKGRRKVLFSPGQCYNINPASQL